MFAISELKVKYSMLRSIANGSFGMVYQMQNKVNRKDYKMKTVSFICRLHASMWRLSD